MLSVRCAALVPQVRKMFRKACLSVHPDKVNLSLPHTHTHTHATCTYCSFLHQPLACLFFLSLSFLHLHSFFFQVVINPPSVCVRIHQIPSLIVNNKPSKNTILPFYTFYTFYTHTHTHTHTPRPKTQNMRHWLVPFSMNSTMPMPDSKRVEPSHCTSASRNLWPPDYL